MARPPLRAVIPAVALVLFAVGCGTEKIELDPGEQADVRHGAELFALRCSGCHTFSPAGAEGSASDANRAERKDGPNLDVRKVEYQEVLYAIRNGGFSTSQMPQNIVVGQDAEDVARFVAKYSGRQAPETAAPEQRSAQ